MLPQSLEELDAIRDECRRMVAGRASLSAGASALPLPGLDAAADVAILLQLIPAINQRFGVAPGQMAGYDAARKQLLYQMIRRAGSALLGMEVTRTLLAAVLKKVAGRLAAKQALKLAPLLGWAANAAIGFAAMKYIGNSHIDDCYAVCRRMLEQGAATPE
ncbi:hypothetical protein [Chromobacterium sphagni]|uniref:DUF697 domain-containing protein n=1 Tax=Chromobacterium sphagni TaxID=1903179 RepID=A0A1S1X5P0_9NEIS|nr:hypothetical protein [Chromobacterium sphagni]OHX14769.1 hypothetical protein BI347_15600 [Chromobacterium sphagni]OHX16480.1 hypothetical protein BI344_21345 [Chromobacterium sphagni]